MFFLGACRRVGLGDIGMSTLATVFQGLLTCVQCRDLKLSGISGLSCDKGGVCDRSV